MDAGAGGLAVAVAGDCAGVLLMAAAAVGVHTGRQQRRDGGYLTTDTVHVDSAGHAVTIEEIDLDGLNGDWLLGTARVRATAADGAPVFIGVAPTDEVADYLDGVAHSTVTELDDDGVRRAPGRRARPGPRRARHLDCAGVRSRRPSP